MEKWLLLRSSLGTRPWSLRPLIILSSSQFHRIVGFSSYKRKFTYEEHKPLIICQHLAEPCCLKPCSSRGLGFSSLLSFSLQMQHLVFGETIMLNKGSSHWCLYNCSCVFVFFLYFIKAFLEWVQMSGLCCQLCLQILCKHKDLSSIQRKWGGVVTFNQFTGEVDMRESLEISEEVANKYCLKNRKQTSKNSG